MLNTRYVCLEKKKALVFIGEKVKTKVSYYIVNNRELQWQSGFEVAFLEETP